MADKPSIEDTAALFEATGQEVGRFMALFKGSERSCGVYSVKTGQGSIVEREANSQDYSSHLAGMRHLGIVPLLLDGTSWFMAVDIDNHGPRGKDVDPLKIEQQVRAAGLPLVVCRSKSGGAHLYLFMKQPEKAARLRTVMQRWAAQLGFPKAEIFPKQTELSKDLSGTDRKSVHGNWINLPYQNALETIRYGIFEGAQLPFHKFLDHAESKRWAFNANEIMSSAGMPLGILVEQGPPCVEKILAEKLEEGNRNNALFQVGVFLKRAGLDSDEFRAKISDYNIAAFAKPLTAAEVNKVANSTYNKEYNYRCSEEPCASACDREACLKRKFGISSGDVMANEVPDIEKVIKVEGTPVTWHIFFSGKKVMLTTEDLFDYKRFKMRVFEQIHVVLRPMKNLEWERHVQAAMNRPLEIRKIETKNDVIFGDLTEFLRRARTDVNVSEDARRADLKRGLPAMIGLKTSNADSGTQWMYAFKIDAFLDYLIRRKRMTGQRHEMYQTIQEIMGDNAKRSVRIGEKAERNIWVIDRDKIDNDPIPTREFNTEF